MHLLPFFHRKLVLSPIQFDHPVWIDDDDIDLDYHVRQVALPKPGTDQQLRTLVSRLHMILLDRARPLWQFYVIEGLQAGRFAVYAKLHHAAVDGGAGMVIMDPYSVRHLSLGTFRRRRRRRRKRRRTSSS